MNELGKAKILVQSIDKLLLLNQDLNIYSDLLKERFNQSESNEISKIHSKLEETIKLINQETNIIFLNKPRKLIKTDSNRTIEVDLSSESIDDLSSNILNLIPIIDFSSINFNSLDYSNEELSTIVYNIFCNTINFEKIHVSPESLKKFIIKVSEHYHLNAFHNYKHAVSVLQFTYFMLNQIQLDGIIINDLYKFALLISALVHDIDHPGHTNTYEINSQSPLAKKYNNNSVLENHHCSTAFYLIQLPNIQLFSQMSLEDYNIVRECIIECIISTDMKYHNELIDMVIKKQLSGLDWISTTNALILCKLLVHLADLSNQLRPYNICALWSSALKREFKNQIKKEEDKNLEVLDFMKVTDNKSYYISEYNFSNFMVLPLVNACIKVFPSIKVVKNILLLNITIWKNLYDSH